MCVRTVLRPEHIGRLGRCLQEDEGHQMQLSELARDCEKFSIKEGGKVGKPQKPRDSMEDN